MNNLRREKVINDEQKLCAAKMFKKVKNFTTKSSWRRWRTVTTRVLGADEKQ